MWVTANKLGGRACPLPLLASCDPVHAFIVISWFVFYLFITPRAPLGRPSPVPPGRTSVKSHHTSPVASAELVRRVGGPVRPSAEAGISSGRHADRRPRHETRDSRVEDESTMKERGPSGRVVRVVRSCHICVPCVVCACARVRARVPCSVLALHSCEYRGIQRCRGADAAFSLCIILLSMV